MAGDPSRGCRGRSHLAHLRLSRRWAGQVRGLLLTAPQAEWIALMDWFKT